ncbi:MAG: transcription termination/antitermination protein NusA, partial [Coriobacteriia bacterium]|nr:transcription termination/antitermination protein NusA [Coriobacteriia bacterium]
MSSELMDALKALAREKNIDEYEMLDKLEQQLAQTYKRILDLENDTRVVLDRETGRIYVYELVPVGGTEKEPEFEEHDITPKDVSRIAAQAAKSVIMGSIREAEREKIFDEYSDRVGESVTGTVQQSDSRYTLIKLREGVEALLPPSEQPHNERYDHNQRIKAYIIEVRKTSNEPSIVVSRTHPGLIRRLFELEVPEIYDGIVEIKSVAREPGLRSKVAVSSRESGLDPVGACVGPKGSRVRMIV